MCAWIGQRCYLVRHGRTALDADGRLRGHLDPPLDEVGRAEVEDLAIVLASLRPSRIVTSPLLRAVPSPPSRHRAGGRAGAGRQAADRPRLRPVAGKRQASVIAEWAVWTRPPGWWRPRSLRSGPRRSRRAGCRSGNRPGLWWRTTRSIAPCCPSWTRSSARRTASPSAPRAGTCSAASTVSGRWSASTRRSSDDLASSCVNVSAQRSCCCLPGSQALHPARAGTRPDCADRPGGHRGCLGGSSPWRRSRRSRPSSRCCADADGGAAAARTSGNTFSRSRSHAGRNWPRFVVALAVIMTPLAVGPGDPAPPIDGA